LVRFRKVSTWILIPPLVGRDYQEVRYGAKRRA